MTRGGKHRRAQVTLGDAMIIAVCVVGGVGVAVASDMMSMTIFRWIGTTMVIGGAIALVLRRH